MSIGAAIREARLARGQTQQVLAKSLFVSDSLLSSWETGKQKLPREMRRPLAEKLDNPRLYMELANELCGGVMAPAYLDGPAVDLHRASVRDKAIEELSEAIEALSKARALVNARSAEHLKDLDRQQIRNCLNELAEAQTSIGMMIAVICETYGVSPGDVYRQHRQELAAKGYIARAKEKSAQKRR